jgi:small-conductance mechanosensitive channel
LFRLRYRNFGFLQTEKMTALAKSFRGSPRFGLCFTFLTLLLLCSLPSVAALGAEQKTDARPKAVEPLPAPPPATIPLADIATWATAVSNLIGNLTAGAKPSAQIENIAKTLPELSEKLDAQFVATTKSLEAEPTLETLQNEQQLWQAAQLQATGWLNALTLEATKLQDSLNRLTELQKLWSTTRASAQTAKAPGPILQQMDATLTAIIDAQAPLQAQRANILNLQSRVAEEATRCGTALQRIADFQQKAVAGILSRDAPPIWTIDLWSDAVAALPEHAGKIAGAYWTDVDKYLRDPRQGGALHPAIFIFLALVFSAARRKIAVWEKSGADASSAILVFERPYAAALATTLVLVTAPLLFQLPTTVRQLLTIVSLVPMLCLARPMIGASVAFVLYACGFLFAVDTLRQVFGGIQVIGQAILVAETLAAIIVLYSMRRHYREIIAARAESSGLIVLKLGRFLLIIVLLVGLLAAVAGYTRLARLLTPGIFVGGVLALIFFASLRVSAGLIALALRVWPLFSLQMVAHHRELLERRVYRVLIWAAVMGWLVRYLSYLGLLDPAWSLAEALLATKLERGSIAISLGNVLEFVLTVWLAYLLSRFLRFVLQEDVYPRIDLGPGLSYAASSLLNYIILALGFVAALGVLGVDFSKVSLLAGAFSVGIGFGLQSVVNNFVSGLILLFERPIHIGDTVEVGSLQGTVRRIGIRASVIHMYTGADIIVPNSQLVTEKVTNWTLSDRLRRVDLPVGVNYGADPKKVIELLEQVARAHPDVLREPAPRALFTGYGDSSINFELRVWPSQFNQAVQVRSDLATAVFDAVNAADGMSFPFPQREVRLLRDAGENAAEAAAKPEGKT